MAMSRRTDATGEPTTALITRCAREVFPGAEVDEQRRRLFVPVGGGRAGITLDGLTARLADTTPAAHEAMVRSWLAAVAVPVQDVRRPDTVPPVAADLLRVRVMREGDPDALSAIVSEPIPYGFRGVVVHPDGDGLPAHLAPEQVATYDVGVDAVVRIAVENTVTQELLGLEPRIQEVDGHPLVQFRQPGNPFVSAVVLTVGQRLPGGTTAGALVIAPSYDEVILRPVSRRSDLDAVPMLAAVARQRHAASEDPCTTHVSWWHENTLWPLIVADDGSGAVVVPEALQAVVDSLPAT